MKKEPEEIICEYCGKTSKRYCWIEDDNERHYFCSADCASEGMDMGYDKVLDAIYPDCSEENEEDED